MAVSVCPKEVRREGEERIGRCKEGAHLSRFCIRIYSSQTDDSGQEARSQMLSRKMLPRMAVSLQLLLCVWNSGGK